LAGNFFCWQRRDINAENQRKFKFRGCWNCHKWCETEEHAWLGFAVVGRRTAIAVAHFSVGHRGRGHAKRHARQIRRMRNTARGKDREEDHHEKTDQVVHPIMLSCFRVMSRYR